MSNLIGQQIGSYRLTRYLGKDGSAEAYQGTHLHLGTYAALKVYFNLQPAEIEHFRQEALLMAHLNHPNIIRVFSYDQVSFGKDFLYYLVREFCPAGSLALWLQQRANRQIPFRDVVAFAEQAANALKYIHGQRIVHGAINPSAFLIDPASPRPEQPRWLLADIGLANLLEKDQEITLKAETVAYIAPEQLAGRSASSLSDQYSLATIIYELLTGRPAVQGNMAQNAAKRLHYSPVAPGQIRPDIPTAVDTILLTALAPAPEKRFPSVSAFASALLSALNSAHAVQLFFSYDRKDQKLRDQLEEHLSILKYRGLITTWHEQEIHAGEDRAEQINRHLEQASIILLLISPAFMASDYCYSKEMQYALAKHRRGDGKVVPVLLRPVLISNAPFSTLEVLPSNRKPVVIWRNRDTAFVDIALNIERAVQQMREEAVLKWGVSPTMLTGTLADPGSFRGIPPGPNALPTVAGTYQPEAGQKNIQTPPPHQGQESQEAQFQRQLEDEQDYYQKALAAYEQALDQNPRDIQACKGKASVFLALKQSDKALAALEKALAIEPAASIYTRIGDIYLQLQQFARAVTAYQQALALDPAFALAYAHLSDAFGKLGRAQEAAEARQRATKLGYEDEEPL
jgi:serine/threonine protein kinase